MILGLGFPRETPKKGGYWLNLGVYGWLMPSCYGGKNERLTKMWKKNYLFRWFIVCGSEAWV